MLWLRLWRRTAARVVHIIRIRIEHEPAFNYRAWTLTPPCVSSKLMHYTPPWQNLSDQRCRFKLRERCLRDRSSFTGSFFLLWHNHGLAIRYVLHSPSPGEHHWAVMWWVDVQPAFLQQPCKAVMSVWNIRILQNIWTWNLDEDGSEDKRGSYWVIEWRPWCACVRAWMSE